MTDLVDFEVLTRMLSRAADAVRANSDYLSKLDCATGDGDHGAAMTKVGDAIVKTIENDKSQSMSALLNDMGWAVMSTDAGSSSSLQGSFFLGMSEGVGEKDALDNSGLADMLGAGEAKLRKQTKAQEGDKTVIDALVPAVRAIRTMADSGGDIAKMLAKGAEAAEKGAESTKDMKAAFGRAKNLGDRTIGHVDPGATSMSYMFNGFKEGYENG
ncbi:dihydroxyacetone kinase subunit DhaL [Verrucomicrobiota bacterium]